MEDLTNMTASLESKKTRYYNDLEQLHQKLSYFFLFCSFYRKILSIDIQVTLIKKLKIMQVILI